MPDVLDDPIAARLRRIPASDAVRASAWDAYHDAADQDDLEKRLRGLSIPDDAKADLWDLKSSQAPAAKAPTGVRVKGDTFADKIRNAASILGSGALGIAKGAAHTALDIGEMGANAGLIPGLGVLGLGHPGIDAMRAATAYKNVPEQIGGMVETAGELALPAIEAGKAGLALGQQVAMKMGPAAVEVASHLPVVGTPIRWARTGAKILGHVLDSAAASKANAGGRVVTASKPTTLNQALADALEELRQPPAAPTVQLPPPAELPAGYTPRTTVPKPKLVTKAAPAEAPSAASVATEPPKRAYFLKPEAEIAAAADAGPRVTPTGQIRVQDLPASWQARVGQDLFPMAEADAKAAGEAFLKELTDRGVSVGKAMMSVSKNPDIPVQVRQQLLKTLSRVNTKGAQ